MKTHATIPDKGYVITVTSAPCDVSAIREGGERILLMTARKPGQYGLISPSSQIEVQDDRAVISPSDYSVALVGTKQGGAVPGNVAKTDGDNVFAGANSFREPLVLEKPPATNENPLRLNDLIAIELSNRTVWPLDHHCYIKSAEKWFNTPDGLRCSSSGQPAYGTSTIAAQDGYVGLMNPGRFYNCVPKNILYHVRLIDQFGSDVLLTLFNHAYAGYGFTSPANRDAFAVRANNACQFTLTALTGLYSLDCHAISSDGSVSDHQNALATSSNNAVVDLYLTASDNTTWELYASSSSDVLAMPHFNKPRLIGTATMPKYFTNGLAVGFLYNPDSRIVHGGGRVPLISRMAQFIGKDIRDQFLQFVQ